MDKISVIVPVYKVEEYLPKCIESIINQTHKNLEIILVDDGSPDNCGKICDEYARTDERIKVIHKENGGQASARNRGLDIATGDYIAFVDSDDYIEEDMYECLYNALIKCDADISICGSKNIYPNGRIIEVVPDKKGWILDNNELMKAYYKTPYIYPAPWNKLYKKDIWKDVRFPEGVYREDAAITYKLLYKVSKAVHTGEAKYMYIQREGSSERQTFRESMLVYNNTVDEEFRFVKENYPELINTLKDHIVNTRLRFIKSIVRSGNMKKHKKSIDEMKDFLKENEPCDKSLSKTRRRILNCWIWYVADSLLRYRIRMMLLWIIKKVKR